MNSAKVNSLPAEWKHSRSATLRNWRVDCRSEWLTDCTQLLHYVLMLRPFAPVFTLANRQNAGIHYSLRLRFVVDPLLPHTSPQMSGYIASLWSLQLLPWCFVSKRTCHCQQAAHRASRPGHQAHQHFPGGPEVTRRLAVPGQAGPVVGLRRMPDEVAEALPWLEHMVSPVISGPGGHLWMEALMKAGFVTVCSVVRLRLSFFLAELGRSVGSGTAEWAENSWPIQSRLLPCRKPSPCPPSLAHQHPQTHRQTRLGSVSSSVPSFFLLPSCPLDAFLVWI